MVSWKDWSPGLDNNRMTLKEAQDTLPGNDPEAINFLVRLFENPKSPIAFKGAISLERHDCVHILLGRGLLSQDEAFVIGYTMGTSRHISRLELSLFKLITKKLYPHPYKFSEKDLVAYNLGIEYGKLTKALPIFEFPFEEYMDKKLGEIRRLLDVRIADLKKLYAAEQVLVPGTKCSRRLPL